jgi:hypothetical protein
MATTDDLMALGLTAEIAKRVAKVLPTTLTDSSGGTASDTIAAMTNTDALTHSAGTADGTVDDVGAVFSQTTLNNNFKEVSTELASQRTLNTALINAVASLTAKVNALSNGS